MNTPNMANADYNCPKEQERERERGREGERERGRERDPGWVWSSISEDRGDNK